MRSEAGFSLIEVIISMAVLLTVLLGLLYGLVLASNVFLLTEERFQSILERWNESQGFYQSADPATSKFRPCPSCFPIHRSQAGSSEDSWEVLHGR